MFKSLLALATISSASALTVISRTSYSGCTGTSPTGTGQAMTGVLTGCSDAGYADCSKGYFVENSTDGALQCPNKIGTTYNITGICNAGSNIVFSCGTLDATKVAATVTLHSGVSCNGTSLPLGVVTEGVCAMVTASNWIKMWANSTGSFVATFSAAGCDSATQDNAVQLSASGLSGCVAQNLAGSYASAYYSVVQTLAPTAAPGGNNTNTTSAPASSGSVVIASLASAVVAAASLML